jgi:hemerythrin-like domain-containing protein
MSDALLLLDLEHRSFGDLLNVIDDQRRNLEDGGPVDTNLLQSVAETLRGYPDECHHPVEDLVLRRLCMRASEAVPDPAWLFNEHRELRRLARQFSTTLAAMVSNDDAQTPELGELMEEFVNYYRNHMMMEREHFFSAAAKALTRQDWEEIEFDLFDREDPLVDRSAHQRFQSLREEIQKSASKLGKRAFRLRQAKRVQQLVSVSDFNKSMLDRGCFLVRHPQGGYGLERDGDAMTDIPECSETQAVWCAYYFLQGQERPMAFAA